MLSRLLAELDTSILTCQLMGSHIFSKFKRGLLSCEKLVLFFILGDSAIVEGGALIVLGGVGFLVK